MRRLLPRRTLLVIAVVLAGAADAEASPSIAYTWLDLEIELGALPPLQRPMSGVATIDWVTVGQPQLELLRLSPHGARSGTFPVTDPEVTSQIPSIRIDVTPGIGTFTGLTSGPSIGAPKPLPLRGILRFCLYTAGCASSLPLAMTTNAGNTGFGIGGLLTAGALGPIRISVVNSPWTIGTVSAVNQTAGGGFVTVSRAGFVHGPASATTSLGQSSAVIRLVAPQQVTTSGISGFPSQLSSFSHLEIKLLEIPEPGLLTLLVSGAVAVALLGRSRRRR